MRRKIVVGLCRVSIIFLFLVGMIICFWWYPFSISLFTVGLTPGEALQVTREQNIAFAIQLLFSWLTSIPCFAVLVMFFRSTGYMKREETLCRKNVEIFRIVFRVILADSIIFILGNVVFMFLEWNPFAIMYYIIGGIGLVFALTNYGVFMCMSAMALIKEENDSIL